MKTKHVIFISAVLIGCSTTSLLTPEQKDVDRVKNKYPGYTLTDLQQGKKLYEQHCGSCHRLKDPASKSEEKWTKVVPHMVAKVNKRTPDVLDTKKEELILKYVITMKGRSNP